MRGETRAGPRPLHPRRGRPRPRDALRTLLRCRARGSCRQRHGRPLAGAGGPWHRSGRRGRHRKRDVRADSGRNREDWGDARSRGRRRGDLHSRPRAAVRRHNGADQVHSARAPLWSMRGHALHPRRCRPVRRAGPRGLCAGAWRGLGGAACGQPWHSRLLQLLPNKESRSSR